MTISDWMTIRGVKQFEVAEALEITTEALRNKLKSGQFWLREIKALNNVLKLTLEETTNSITEESENFNRLNNLKK